MTGLVNAARSWWRERSDARAQAARAGVLRASYLRHLAEERLSFEQRVGHHLYHPRPDKVRYANALFALVDDARRALGLLSRWEAHQERCGSQRVGEAMSKSDSQLRHRGREANAPPPRGGPDRDGAPS